MTRLGLYTQNLRFYYNMLGELRRWELPVVSLKAGTDSPKDVPVIFSSIDDPVFFFNQVRGDLPIQMIRHILPKILGERSFGQVIVGIDPGPKPGVAVLADNILVEAHEFSDLHKLKEFITQVKDHYDYESIMLRIGHGDKPNRNRILNALYQVGMKIFIVNEEGTSMPHQTHDNIISAARIADIDRFNRTGRNNIYGKTKRTQLEDEFLTIKNCV